MRSPDHRSSINLSWQGYGASRGTAVGTALVIHNNNDFLVDCDDDDIIVARHATPAIFPLLLRARAAVCENGGLLCHLAVLAREIGKPCVTGVAGILDAVQTGDRMQIDGANGTVSLITSNDRPQPPSKTSTLQQGSADFVPVMQFGRFSPAFEFAQPHFDLGIAINIAALISLPTRLCARARLEYLISEREVLLAKTSLSVMVNSLCDRLETRSLDFSELKRSYETLSAASGWVDLQSEFASLDDFKSALKRYFQMAQITWTSACVRDALVSRYWTFLSNVSMNAEISKRRELFLSTLITPGCSYIVSCLVDEQGKSHKWSENLRSFAGLNDFQIEATRALTSEARQQRNDAIQALSRLLGQDDFDRAQLYMNTLTDLVVITERKNTDLNRCEELLFGDEAPSSQSAASLGLSGTESACNQQSRQTIVDRVLASLAADDYLYCQNEEFLSSAPARAGI